MKTSFFRLLIFTAAAFGFLVPAVRSWGVRLDLWLGAVVFFVLAVVELFTVALFRR